MSTSEHTLKNRVIQKVSAFTVFTALLLPLSACTETGQGSGDSEPSLNAAQPVSIETSSAPESSTNLYSDASTPNSTTTAGFVGEVRNDSIYLKWKADPDATGYNIYRQGEYYTTVFNNEFRDADIHARNYAYEIKGFEKNGENTRYYTVAKGLLVSVAPEPVNTQYFRSAVTLGFVGEVLDDSIRISWKSDAKATGYNVYRQGNYYTTVFDAEFYDKDFNAQDYIYEIKGFQKSTSGTRYFSVAKGLTVSVGGGAIVKDTTDSNATDGFTGQLIGDTIRVNWKKDSSASGYNIYRQGEYYNTVFTTEFNDSNIENKDYSYEIKAFEKSSSGTRYYTIAEGLIVSVTGLGGSGQGTGVVKGETNGSGDTTTGAAPKLGAATPDSTSTPSDSADSGSESVATPKQGSGSTGSSGQGSSGSGAAPVAESPKASSGADGITYRAERTMVHRLRA